MERFAYKAYPIVRLIKYRIVRIATRHQWDDSKVGDSKLSIGILNDLSRMQEGYSPMDRLPEGFDDLYDWFSSSSRGGVRTYGPSNVGRVMPMPVFPIGSGGVIRDPYENRTDMAAQIQKFADDHKGWFWNPETLKWENSWENRGYFHNIQPLNPLYVSAWEQRFPGYIESVVENLRSTPEKRHAVEDALRNWYSFSEANPNLFKQTYYYNGRPFTGNVWVSDDGKMRGELDGRIVNVTDQLPRISSGFNSIKRLGQGVGFKVQLGTSDAYSGFKKDKNDAYFRDPGNPKKKGGIKNKKKQNTTRNVNINVNPGKVKTPYRKKGSVTTKKDGTMRVEFSEPYCSVVGYSAQTVQNLASGVPLLPEGGSIQPGLSFKWLKRFATLYEQYRIHNLAFKYVPSLPPLTGGLVTLGFDLDCEDVNADLQKVQMLTYTYTGPAVTPAVLTLPQKVFTQVFKDAKWIRSGAFTNDEDPHLYDCGKLWVGSQAMNISGGSWVDGTVMGQLWVSYDVELFQPHVNPDPAEYTNDKLVGTATDISHPFGAAGLATWSSRPFSCTTDPQSVIGWRWYATTGLSTLTVGQWLFVLEMNGTGLTATNPTVSVLGITQSILLWMVNAAGTKGVLILRVDVTNVSAGPYGSTLQLDFTPCATTCTTYILRVTQYLYNYAVPFHGQIVDRKIELDEDEHDMVEVKQEEEEDPPPKILRKVR